MTHSIFSSKTFFGTVYSGGLSAYVGIGVRRPRGPSTAPSVPFDLNIAAPTFFFFIHSLTDASSGQEDPDVSFDSGYRPGQDQQATTE